MSVLIYFEKKLHYRLEIVLELDWLSMSIINDHITASISLYSSRILFYSQPYVIYLFAKLVSQASNGVNFLCSFWLVSIA